MKRSLWKCLQQVSSTLIWKQNFCTREVHEAHCVRLRRDEPGKQTILIGDLNLNTGLSNRINIALSRYEQFSWGGVACLSVSLGFNSVKLRDCITTRISLMRYDMMLRDGISESRHARLNPKQQTFCFLTFAARCCTWRQRDCHVTGWVTEKNDASFVRSFFATWHHHQKTTRSFQWHFAWDASDMVPMQSVFEQDLRMALFRVSPMRRSVPTTPTVENTQASRQSQMWWIVQVLKMNKSQWVNLNI